MFPSASLLALSATCTIKIRKRVANVLDLREESTIMITKSPNRSNIKLVISKTNNTIEEGMYWLISGMETLRHAFPKTLIYANSISDVAKLYTYVVNELPDCAEFVDMFHSETTEENKKTILNALRDNTSTKRVVFATSALGMGIDIGNCQSVVLYGPPHSVVDLVQEIGRVGRDGQSSVAIMLYNSYHLRNVNKDIKTLFKSETCRRQVLMGNFLEEPQLTKLKAECNLHTCCDVCAKLCLCGKCEKLPVEKLLENIECVETCSSSDSNTVDYSDLEASDVNSDSFTSDCEEMLKACDDTN